MAVQTGRVDGVSRAGEVLRGFGSWLVGFCKAQPLGAVGLFLVLFAVFIAIFGELLAPADPGKINASDTYAQPEWTGGFILGSDSLGRDNLSRLMIGTRASITISVVAIFFGSLAGFLMGLLSGYYADWRDSVIQRVVDIVMSIPTLVLALAIVATAGQSQRNVIIAIAVIQIPNTARVVRSVVLSVREMEFIQAIRAVGASDLRILIRHIAPQTFAPVMIVITSFLGLAIIIEASLSFLGLGVPPPKPSWGSMVAENATATVFNRAPWNAVFPGLALTLTVFGFNLLGDALRDTLDPRLRRG